MVHICLQERALAAQTFITAAAHVRDGPGTNIGAAHSHRWRLGQDRGEKVTNDAAASIRIKRPRSAGATPSGTSSRSARASITEVTGAEERHRSPSPATETSCCACLTIRSRGTS